MIYFFKTLGDLYQLHGVTTYKIVLLNFKVIWSVKFIWIIFKNSVPASQETKCLSIMKIGQLMLFREIITVYFENHMKHIYFVGKTQVFEY
jgi:hypothetical protein